MMEHMAQWRELAEVSRDEREVEATWYDLSITFVDLSAKQKRKHAEISYARAFMSRLDVMMGEHEE